MKSNVLLLSDKEKKNVAKDSVSKPGFQNKEKTEDVTHDDTIMDKEELSKSKKILRGSRNFKRINSPKSRKICLSLLR